MFKSKGFTIGFIILCAVNLLLLAGLIYVLSGRADKNMDKFVHKTTEAGQGTKAPTGSIPDETGVTETPTDAPTEATEDPAKKQQRTMTTDDPHTMPVVTELIAEKGSISIIESSGYGVVFHKRPAFDSAETEGNLVNYRGTFETDGKIYVPDSDGKPYIMYHTTDGYFVTGNSNYVTYKPSGRTTPENPEKVAEYRSQDGKTTLTIFQEDGSHLVFTLYRNGTPVLENVIAVYDAYGTARFEFLSLNGAATGDLTFSFEEGKLSLLTAVFSKELEMDGTKFPTLALSVNP